MATSIFPTVNAVGGVDAGRKLHEFNLVSWLAFAYEISFVKTGLTGATAGTLTLPVAAGEAFLFGYHVTEDAALTHVLPASSTRDVYYQLTRDVSGYVTGGQLVDVAGGAAAPADSVLLGTAVTSGSAITGWTDKRPAAGSSLAMQGVFASRPAAGRTGRLYWSSDTMELWRDDGATWRFVGGKMVGTFAARPAAGNAGRMYWASDAKRLYRDNGTTWDDVAPGTLIGRTKYNPGTSATMTAVTGVADLAAGSLEVAFTVPSSGNVEVRVEGVLLPVAAGGQVFWSLRDGGNTAQGDEVLAAYVANSGVADARRQAATFQVTGLTPGAAVTLKWAHRGPTGAAGATYAGQSNVAALGGVAPGPALMEVFAA